MEIKIKELLTGVKERFDSSDKRIKIFAVIGVIGIALILLSEAVPEKTEKPASAPSESSTSYSDYISALEEETQELISSIDGAGRCKVMITLKDTNESVFAKNSEENKTDGSYSKAYEICKNTTI